MSVDTNLSKNSLHELSKVVVSLFKTNTNQELKNRVWEKMQQEICSRFRALKNFTSEDCVINFNPPFASNDQRNGLSNTLIYFGKHFRIEPQEA